MKVRWRKIEEEVSRLLQGSGVKSAPVPVEKIARSKGVAVVEQPFPQGEGEMSGFLYREGDFTLIGVNALQATTRKRFTCAHELGHWALHDPGKAYFVDRVIRYRNEASSEGTDVEEREANAFAAELLMPRPLLEVDFAAERMTTSDEESLLAALAERYQVSEQAMMYRLINLRLIRPYV